MSLLNAFRSLMRMGAARVMKPFPAAAAVQDDPTEQEKWHQWYVQADGREPWTERNVNKYLVKHRETFLGTGDSQKKVFVPMCGKAVEIKWFYDQGHDVVGVEGSSRAVTDFISQHNIESTQEDMENFSLTKSKDGRMKIYCGDFFKFNSSIENGFEAVWDRGALGSISTHLRERYCELMLEEGLLAKNCLYLVEGWDYDTSIWQGPPNILSEEHLTEMMGSEFDVSLLERYEFVTSEFNKDYLLTEKGDPVQVHNHLYLLRKTD